MVYRDGDVMARVRVIRIGAALLFAILLAACGSSESSQSAAAEATEELTGEHAGETAEEHAEHAEQDQVDQAAEAAAAEALAAGHDDDHDGDDHDGDDHGDAAAGDLDIVDGTDPEATVDGTDPEPIVPNPDDTSTVTDAVDPDPDAAGTVPDFEDPEAMLGLILPAFGVTDVEGVSACLDGEATAAGISTGDLINGDGLMVGLVRCARDDVGEELRQGFDAIDTTGLDATPEQIDCSFDATLDYFAGLDIATANGIFAGDAPAEAVQALVDNCGLSEADADFLLNDA